MSREETQLEDAISRWIDGDLDSAGLRELADRLRGSVDARRVYYTYMAVHAELDGAAVGKEQVASLSATGDQTQPTIEMRATSKRGRTLWRASLAIAATIAVMVGGWTLWGTLGGSRGADAIRAEVADVSADCEWFLETTRGRQRQPFRCGDRLRVTSGKLQLRYAHGVAVTVQGPALYELVSTTDARLMLGRMTVHVDEGGRGFTVLSPRATVVDLGTEFGIDVKQDGATDVLVFQGEVDVDFVAPGAGESPQQRLRMGEGVRLDASGTRSRIVSFDSEQYARGIDDAERKRDPVIATVTDNISRSSSRKFYEIVHGGMREDALAFVDRVAHQYNGLDERGMPAYLVGGDYVKTFNNDKDFYDETGQIDVTLATPANLYVLLDARIKPPQWLKESFAETGDVVGLDVGPFYDPERQVWHNQGPSGVGPGESVDDKLAIWVQQVRKPATVHLGPLGSLSPLAPDSVELRNPLGRNMYGIVAVPMAPGE